MAAPENGKDKKGMNKHGLPTGIRFVPKDLELFDILEHRLRGLPLHREYDGVFHEVRILDFHPAKLYETYAEDEKEGYIYFFSTTEFPGRKKMRAVRAAQGGQWKASGTCDTVKVRGVAIGRKLSMAFYERGFDGDNDPVRTSWGMHEFARIIGPKNKAKLADVAVYRLYRKNGEEMPEDLAAGAAESMNMRGKASGAAMALPQPAPDLPQPMPVLPSSAPGLPDTMVFMANVASNSQAYAPKSSMSQLQQEWHQNAYAAAAAAPNAAVPSNFWAPPSAARPSSRAPPSAPGHYGYVASMDSRQPLVQLPPLAASPLGRKRKAPMISTEHAGYAWGPPAANYQPPPPPLQGTEHTFGSGGVVRHEDDWQQEPVAMRTDEEGYLMADERNMWCNRQGGSSSGMAASAVLDDGSAAVPQSQGGEGSGSRRRCR